ncbi:MAG: hypothetical protein M1820_000896 [Bogoriella megaspora]|nr:MAG: hypothetical protein M1820_000896 [Bogoriella megaspora]
MSSEDSIVGRSLFLITYPRVASNLFVKILSLQNQPDVLTKDMGGYFFLPAFMTIDEHKLHSKHVDDWTEEERSGVKCQYQAGFDQLQGYVNRARSEHKILFVKEHANLMANPMKQSQYIWDRESTHEDQWRLQVPQSLDIQPQYSTLNDSVLPDHLLRQIQPTFLIRHPALVFPSNYRVEISKKGRVAAAATKREALDITMSMRWSRQLYDFYMTKPQLTLTKSRSQPVIIDAYDVINAPQQLFPRFCTLTGLDPSKLTFNWKRTSDETRSRVCRATSPAAASYLSTIWASEGIIKEKAIDCPEEIDIGLEAVKWREEFGEAEARKLEEWVRRAMPDYMYMWERRLKPEPETSEDDGEVKIDEEPSCLTTLLSAFGSVCSRVYWSLRSPKPRKEWQEKV